MNLNTYRCGCGKIETLAHAKARPGPCTHGVRPAPSWQPTGDGFGRWTFFPLDGGDKVALHKAVRGRAETPLMSDIESLPFVCRTLDKQRRMRGERAWDGIRQLVKQIGFANACGMRIRRKDYATLQWRDPPLQIVYKEFNKDVRSPENVDPLWIPVRLAVRRDKSRGAAP